MRPTFRLIKILIAFACFIWVFSNDTLTYASWSLNTLESQTGAMWAGENLVWNDTRLGSLDVFIRDKVGLISPILTGAHEQTVLAADEQALLISDSDHGDNNLYVFRLDDRTFISLGNFADVSFASIVTGQAAWGDGGTVWWWDGQKTITRKFDAKQLLITKSGLIMMGKDQITLWSSSGDQIITCLSCVKIVPHEDQFVFLNGAGILAFGVSSEIIDDHVSSLFSTNDSLIYQINNQTIINNDQRKVVLNKTIPQDAQISQLGIASDENLDINFELAEPPSVSVASCDLSPNVGTCKGVGAGNRIISRAIDAKDVEHISYINFVNNSWGGRLLPNNVADGPYQISIRAEGIFGALSDWANVGNVLVDTTVPKITENEVEVQNDRVRIHIQTDEKTSAKINIIGDGEPISRSLSRLTFSHTSTISDLDADQLYEVDAVLTDFAMNSVNSHMSFSTPPLTNSSYQILTSIEKKQAGVWEGELVLPPGVIDDKIAILRISTPDGYKLIRLQWTIGLPPPLKRHRLVRVKGRVNSAGTAILVHRAKAIAVINSSSDPPIYDTVSMESVVADTFIEVQGELTSVAKSGWRVKVDQNVWRLHWENMPTNDLQKGDTIRLFGYSYLSGETMQIAGIDAILISRPLPKPATIKKVTSKDSNDEQLIISEKHRAAEVLSKITTSEASLIKTLTERTITVQTANIYDKSNNLWYNLVLYGASVIINFTFFFRRRKITRRS